MKKPKEAEDELEMLKKLRYNERSARLNKDKKALYDILNGLGLHFYNKGSFQQAATEFGKALRAARNEREQLYPLKLSGVVYQQLSGQPGWFKQAVAFHKKHLVLAKKLGIFTETVDGYLNLGLTYFSAFEIAEDRTAHADKLARAKKHFQEALAFLGRTDAQKEFPIEKRKADLFVNLGLVFKDEKQWEAALAQFAKATAVAEAAGYEKGVMLAHFNTGAIHVAKGQFAAALPFLEKDRAINERLELCASEVKTLSMLAKCYFEVGALDKTRAALKRQQTLVAKHLDCEEYRETLSDNAALLRKVQTKLGVSAKVGGLLEQLQVLQKNILKDTDRQEEDWNNEFVSVLKSYL